MLFPSGSSTLFKHMHQQEIDPAAHQIGDQIPRVADRGGFIEQRRKLPEKAAEQDKQYCEKAAQRAQADGGKQEVGEGQNDQPRQNIVKIADEEEPECAGGKGLKKIHIAEVEKPRPGKHGQVEWEQPP